MSRSAAFFRSKAGRRDANHAAIRDGLRKLGHFVQDLAAVGDGCPDLMVIRSAGFSFVAGWLDATPVFLELKAGRGKLRASQLAWREQAEARGIRVATVRTLDEALEALR